MVAFLQPPPSLSTNAHRCFLFRHKQLFRRPSFKTFLAAKSCSLNEAPLPRQRDMALGRFAVAQEGGDEKLVAPLKRRVLHSWITLLTVNDPYGEVLLVEFGTNAHSFWQRDMALGRFAVAQEGGDELLEKFRVLEASQVFLTTQSKIVAQ